MPNLIKPLLTELKNSAIAIAFFALAAAILATPIQLHFSISRIQHFGLASFTAGLGYIVQTVWSWKNLKLWARIIQSYFGLWFGTVGIILYGNPWLEPAMAIRTEAQEALRDIIIRSISLMAVPIPLIAFMWIREELAARRKPDTAGHEEQRSNQESPS